jgi:hypothetical protein
LRQGMVGTDGNDFSAGRFELRVVVPTRRQFLYSRGGEVEDVELDDEVFLAGDVA